MSLMIEYSKDDINYDLAYNAHRGTSHTPEKRAEQVRSSYVSKLDAMVEEFSTHVTDTNKHEIKAALEYYKEGYIQRLNSFLSAQSRCMSSMITGPSNFPVARNEKRNNTADKRRDEWLEWSKKAKEKMARRFDPAILARAPISSDDPTAVELLQAKIERLEALQVTMKAVNKILRKKKLTNEQKIAQLFELGLDQLPAVKLFIPDFSGNIGYPPYKLINNNATIKQAEKRIAQLEKEQDRSVVEDYKIGDVTVSENRDLNRLQLFFPGKPSEEMRTKLKSNGFKRARSQEAWQRQLNDSARHAAERILK